MKIFGFDLTNISMKTIIIPNFQYILDTYAAYVCKM